MPAEPEPTTSRSGIDDLIVRVADDYVRALRAVDHPAAATGDLMARRRAAVIGALASAFGLPSSSETPGIDPLQAVVDFFRSGASTDDGTAASALLLEVAEPLVRDALPGVEADHAIAVLTEQIAENMRAFIRLLMSAVAAGPRELADQERLRGILTPRESEVFSLVVQRAHPPEIAVRLGMAANTVKHHVTSIGRKLDASGASEILARGREAGLIIVLPPTMFQSVSPREPESRRDGDGPF